MMIYYFIVAMFEIAVKSAAVMKKTSLIISSICVLALAACGPGRTEQAEIAKKEAEEAKAAQAPVELPPSITSSTNYRCRGGAVAYVDYFGENVAAQIRLDDKNSLPVRVEPAEDAPEDPMVSADGTVKLVGTGSEVSLTWPEKGTMVCKG